MQAGKGTGKTSIQKDLKVAEGSGRRKSRKHGSFELHSQALDEWKQERWTWMINSFISKSNIFLNMSLSDADPLRMIILFSDDCESRTLFLLSLCTSRSHSHHSVGDPTAFSSRRIISSQTAHGI